MSHELRANMITVAVNGACGRMGSRIVALVSEDKDLKLVSALERDGHPSLKEDIGAILGLANLGVMLTTEIESRADVLIDFSSPDALENRVDNCVEKGVGMVIGTTGLKDSHHKKLAQAVKSIPCLVSPNMGIGVNLVFDLVAQVSKALGEGFDIEIIEAHHRRKKDAPSGTALKIAERICEATERNMETDVVYGRHGMIGERPAEQIGIHAVRHGATIGDHSVIFSSLDESIEINHRAHSRDIFVRGAIRAAKFIAGKPPGLYSLKDVLRQS